jgi:hypothetical protein
VGKRAFGVQFEAVGPYRGLGVARAKYQSYWYGNPLALTIYVNANELRFSPNDGQPFAPLLCINAGQSFHLRGQEICVCRKGWVIFS